MTESWVGAGGSALGAIMAEVERALGGGAAVVVATVVHAGAAELQVGGKLLVRRDGTSIGAIDPAIDGPVQEAALAAFDAFPRVMAQTLYVGADGRSTLRRSQARADDAELLIELYMAPSKLVIVGGGHVGLAIARLGELVGFTIAVLDDREEFANSERFAMADEVVRGEIGPSLDAMRIDDSCYVVLVSRGHMQDAIALRHLAERGAAYLGMIGSRRRTATVLEQMAADGVPREALARVHTPIGLDIGAETPEEIALAILAEIVLVRNGGSGRQLSKLPNRRLAERGD
jgi:xanthine dehydrogenase accessory factor